MSSDTRTVAVPRTGTKVALLASLPFLAAAAYFFLVPVVMQTPQGSIFNCGKALTGYSSPFQKGTCGDLLSINRTRGLVSLVLGLLLAGIGASLFGFDRRQETVEVPDEDAPARRPDDAATSKGTTTATGAATAKDAARD